MPDDDDREVRRYMGGRQCVGLEYRLPRFLARGPHFGWQSGDQLANWTGLPNVTDDPAVQSGSDSSSRYRWWWQVTGEGGGPSWGDLVAPDPGATPRATTLREEAGSAPGLEAHISCDRRVRARTQA